MSSEPVVEAIVVYRDATVGVRSLPRQWAECGFSEIDRAEVMPLSWLTPPDDDVSKPVSIPVRVYRRDRYAFDGRPILCEAPFTTEHVAVEMTVVIAAGLPALDAAKRQARSILDKRVDAWSGFDLTETFEDLEHPDLADRNKPFPGLRLLRHRRIFAHLKTRAIPDGASVETVLPSDWSKASALEQMLFLRRVDRGCWTRTPSCSVCGFPGFGYCRSCAERGIQQWVF